jgi:hypothetical protein
MKNQFAICTHRYGPQLAHPPTHPQSQVQRVLGFSKACKKERNKIEMMPWMIRIYV